MAKRFAAAGSLLQILLFCHGFSNQRFTADAICINVSALQF